jgi:hypothetical protein
MKNLAILIGMPLAIWGVLLYPGWLFWGDAALLHSSVALGLCLVPAALTFVAIQRLTATPDARLLATLGSSAVRMTATLGVGLILHVKMAESFSVVFLYWLLIFYLMVLGLEVGLLVRQPPAGPHSVSK